MNKLLEYMGKVKKFGIIESLKIMCKRKIDVLFCNIIIKIFIRNKPLKNTIVLASHNDFDTNGGAFYDYLIANGYNKKYRIVWLCRNPQYIPKKLPENVVCYPWQYPNLRRDIEICNAKYFLADDWVQKKVRPEQISIYCTHGVGGLKNVHGKITIPESVDYILATTEEYNTILAYQISVPYPNKRFISLGYPVDDLLYSNDRSELYKITSRKFSKVILWMPTFRKNKWGERIDGTKEQPLGIPLISNLDEYNKLNDLLNELNTLLIIKLHPMQDISNTDISSLSNIEILDGEVVKEKRIDNYRLMRCTDALISDYSAVAGDYLHLNKQIAYVFDDIDEYRLGLICENLEDHTAGDFIYSIKDMKEFIRKVYCEDDHYKLKRAKLRSYIFKYSDGNSCKRLAEFMDLQI